MCREEKALYTFRRWLHKLLASQARHKRPGEEDRPSLEPVDVSPEHAVDIFLRLPKHRALVAHEAKLLRYARGRTACTNGFFSFIKTRWQAEKAKVGRKD